MPTPNETTPVTAPAETTPTKPVETKPADVKKPVSQVDVKTSAADILDPSTPLAEPTPASPVAVQGGSSYPTPEALKREADARQKAEDDKVKTQNKETLKSSKMNKNESRSAIDPNHTSVVMPGAIDVKDLQPKADPAKK